MYEYKDERGVGCTTHPDRHAVVIYRDYGYCSECLPRITKLMKLEPKPVPIAKS